MSAAATLSSRRGFVEAVGARFDAAGIEYAFLHATEESDTDSDVDVVVNHRHLAAVEAVVRSGELGRLVNRQFYDVPWCRTYILATGRQDRPFRQLDVACDPFAISRLGPAISVALAHADRAKGTRIVRPAARVVYLATKRAWKGSPSRAHLRLLRSAYEEDPVEARVLLADTWGSVGRRIARALREGCSPIDALMELDERRKWFRRSPTRVGLRLLFSTKRWISRAARPAGLVVQVVGPDGSGKTSVGNAIQLHSSGAFRESLRLHLGPGLLPPPGRLLRREARDTTTPHARPPSARVGSYARVAYLAVDMLLGWLPRVWIPRTRAGLVVLERGWDDLWIDPVRYRLGMGRGLVRTLSRVLPRPDLTILLTGEPRRIADRKPELTELEIGRQINAWQELLRATSRPTCEVDTTEPGANERTEAAILDYLRRRAGDLSNARLALECLGEPSVGGRSYSIVRAGGEPRWLLPRGDRARGPRGVGLYRPATAKHKLGALLLGAMQRSGGHGLDCISLDVSTGLGPEIAASLGMRSVELACLLPTDAARPARATFSVLHEGRPVAIAKVAPTGSAELTRERDVLAAFAAADTGVLTVPLPLASFVWRQYDVLVTSLVPRGGGSDRPLASTEMRALSQLARLTACLEPVLGRAEGRVLVHGDFSAWNSARHDRSRLAVWDWEWARHGLPLEDYFHWQTQRLVHFGRGSIEDLVASALTPTHGVLRVCDECGFEPRRAPEALAASLRAGMVTVSTGTPSSGIRGEALRLLERSG